MRIEKEQLASDIGNMINDANFIYFVSYKGIDVKTISEFRNELAKEEAVCHVLKNRIVKKSAELKGIDIIANMELKGDTALVLGNGDAGSVAKIVKNFAKSTENVIVAKAGYLDGALLSAAEVASIADLPPKEVLQAQLLGVLEAVPRNFVGVLNAKATSILNVLNSYKTKLEA